MNEAPIFHPRRLTEARIAKGLTMSALAAHSNLSPQMVSALENGTRKPTAEALSALAQVLGIKIAYLKEERPFPVTADSAVFFRSSASARNRRNQEMRKQQATWAYEIAAWLDQYVTLPSFDAANFWNESSEPQEHTEESIEEAASNLRSAWLMGTGPIPDMVALLESKGIRVIRQSSGSAKLDAFSRVVNAQPMIFLSSDKASGTRSRFDAAHELGHLLLHPHLSSEEITDPVTLKRIENEANLFAGAFLLPETSFSREIHGVTLGSFLAMKLRWKVSAQALIRRTFNLGAIDAFQYQRLAVDISARGMRRKEPHDDAIQVENPVVLRRSWELLIKHEVISRHQISDELLLPPDFISATLGIPPGSFDTDNIINLQFRDTRNPAGS
ncbi:MAG: ImmA/IrrE family metallo-endopeptidase [Akkermansiaceae bacterium]|nr:ImmA/IrrE family metallo-endopeptidase [Akkermansiaceae bacterium]